MKQVVTFEIAEKEIVAYLDYKRISVKKRETLTEPIDTLIDALQYGEISLDENMNIIHRLKFPLADDTGALAIESFSYAPRITGSTVNSRMKGVAPNDIERRINAYAGALSRQPTQIFEKLDTEDLRITQAVVALFL